MWYVLYTTPRAEKKVKERLNILGVETYLPLHKTSRVWSDRIKKVEVPLFSSYLFIRCKESDLRSFLQVYGVVRILYYCGKPAVIREKEIQAIRTFLIKAEDHPLCIGEEVEILSGALKHVSGKIQKIKKNYLMLHLEELSVTVCVNISEVASVNRIK